MHLFIWAKSNATPENQSCINELGSQSPAACQCDEALQKILLQTELKADSLFI